jgi:hypothetical protein
LASRADILDPSRAITLLSRTKRHTVTFGHAFTLKGVDRSLSPGAYEVVTDEELIEGLSFPVYRRVATAIMLPAQGLSATEMMSVSPDDITAALALDRARTDGDKKPTGNC